MVKQKSYHADDKWRWREIALTTRQPEDFNLALYHLKKQDSNRWMRFWLFFFVLSMGCGWGCTLATRNMSGTGWGLMVMLAGFFANPFLLSNYFSPTELSVCQDVIRMRSDGFEADPVFSVAKARVWSLRWQNLTLVLVETAFMSIFWLSMCLPYTTMIEFNQMKPMPIELALWCTAHTAHFRLWKDIYDMRIKKMPYNIDQIRADFPILQREVHAGKKLVFLDSAASSQKPRQVIEALETYYTTSHANVHRGVHVLSESATAAYEAARDKIQRLINARSRKEIIYTRNATEGLNLVAATWGRVNLTPQDTVVLSELEHHSNIVPWQILQAEKGFKIRYIPVLPDFTFDMEAFYRFLSEESVKLVSVTQVSNVLGYITPLREIVEAAHRVGAVVCVDGAQSVPHMKVDVQALDVDFMAFSGHKMCGPTGIGILYGKRELLEAMPPYMGGGDMIRRVTLEGSTWNDLPYKYEAGTPAIAEAVGLGAAVDYLSSIGMENILTHEQEVVEYAHERLIEIPGLRLLAPPADQRNGVATFTLENAHPHDIAQVLDYEGIAIRAGHHCAMPLHQKLNIPASSRASFYLYNTREEVDLLANALYKAAKVFAGK